MRDSVTRTISLADGTKAPAPTVFAFKSRMPLSYNSSGMPMSMPARSDEQTQPTEGQTTGSWTDSGQQVARPSTANPNTGKGHWEVNRGGHKVWVPDVTYHTVRNRGGALITVPDNQ